MQKVILGFTYYDHINRHKTRRSETKRRGLIQRILQKKEQTYYTPTDNVVVVRRFRLIPTIVPTVYIAKIKYCELEKFRFVIIVSGIGLRPVPILNQIYLDSINKIIKI